jgi:NAD-dependent dihydropyrimidine dehydrogenase PreA subunit
MKSIIFNYKICDKAPECGGISACPVGAITYDDVAKRPVWHRELCTFCLKCTLPDACPVGAILFAGDESQEKAIIDSINSDPRTESWLWQERYGVTPSVSSPVATVITPENFESSAFDPGQKLIDVWHPDNQDCRLHSPLFSDILKGIENISIFKLNAADYPDLAKRLNISVYPSLICTDGDARTVIAEGYIPEANLTAINQVIKSQLAL